MKYNYDMEGSREYRKTISGPEGGVDPVANIGDRHKGLVCEMKEVPLKI